MLDFDLPQAKKDVLWLAGRYSSAREKNGTVILEILFYPQRINNNAIERDEKKEPQKIDILVRAYSNSIVRFSANFSSADSNFNSEMLQIDSSIKQTPLSVKKTAFGFDIIDTKSTIRMRISNNTDNPNLGWSKLFEPPQDMFQAIIYPNGKTEVPFMAYDMFFPKQLESVSLGFVERNHKVNRTLFSFHSKHNEKYAGTGERFAPMNLAGKTFILENNDSLGVNSRRAYKNIPFYISSRGYGLLVLTSAHIRLSLADISTRAAQGLVEDDNLDLCIMGGDVEQIVKSYREFTGFPPEVPLWSYGVWMSRMTYFSADEVRNVGSKLRDDKFPCDVLHIDTGWFEHDWMCDWKFGKKNFPEPEKFIKEMNHKGFRITLWQTPYIYNGNKLLKATKKNYLILCKNRDGNNTSDFRDDNLIGIIDFSNPDAVQWYKGMLKELLQKGVAAIKTDFGERVPEETKSYNMPSDLLHNLYGLLYQKAAFEITKEITGDGIIWARAGWIGCQRYPVHWGGDAATTWDGLAATIRGGLHLGCSGFAYWSHDIPGFHGLPDFMNSKIEDDLYVRWTQVGVFSSHMRYHGTSPREPYNFPKVSDIVRGWLQLRYCLIPYLIEQSKKCTKTGYPVLRALIFHHEDDPICWNIDDQYYFGDSFMIAPILNSENIRDVYLPKGLWTDFWTGEVIEGSKLLKNIKSPLSHIPIYIKSNSTIRIYPEVVQCTDEMNLSKSKNLTIDSSYKGITNSFLGEIIQLE